MVNKFICRGKQYGREYLDKCDKLSKESLMKLRYEEEEEDRINPQLKEIFPVKLSGRQILWINKAVEAYYDKESSAPDNACSAENRYHLFHKVWDWKYIRDSFAYLSGKINNKRLRMKD